MEELDIKTIGDYIIGQTSHVVQKKRNTPKGLQALIDGKYIVKDSYLDAIVDATTPNGTDMCPIERDFDASWPDPMDHLPPPGRESSPKPANAFKPNRQRRNVFAGYTFIFLLRSQRDNLGDAISAGGGKAVVYEGRPTSRDLVEFIRKSARQKGGTGGTVLIQPTEKWWGDQKLLENVASEVNQRIVEQKDFIDVILNNHASRLVQPVRPKEIPSPSSPESPRTQIKAPPPSHDSIQPGTPLQPSRMNRFVSKVDAFDDDFDIAVPPIKSSQPKSRSSPLAKWVASERPAVTDEGKEKEERKRKRKEEKEEEERKKKRKEEDEEREKRKKEAEEGRTRKQQEEDMVSDLLPGAKAMKRHREQFSQSQRTRSAELMQGDEGDAPDGKRRRMDVMEEAKKHRETQEDAQRRRRLEEEANLREALKDMTVDEMKNLAVVEELTLNAMDNAPLSSSSRDRGGDRWDDRWNGRKNFKKFRGRGDNSNRPHRTVDVEWVEISCDSLGSGVHQWMVSDNDRDKSQRQSQRHIPSSVPPGDESGDDDFDSATQSGTLPSDQSARTVRQQKRPRDDDSSDSEEAELRFRFRRRR